MKKRILSMLLALTMLVGMIPATTLTANAATLPEITGLHRGVLADGEDPRFLYWDTTANVEKYEVKCYLNDSLVKTTLADGTDNKELWITMPQNYGYWADNLDVPSGNYKFELTAGYMYGDVFVPNSADSTATVTFSSSGQKYGQYTSSIPSITREPGSEIILSLLEKIFSDFEKKPSIYLIDAPDWLQLSNGVLTGIVPANAQEGTIQIKIGAPATNNIDGYIALLDINIKGEETGGGVNYYEITEVWIQDKEVTPQYWDLWSKFQNMWYTKIVYLDLDGSVKTATGDAIYDFMSTAVPGFLYNAETGKVVGDNTVIQIGKYQYRYELDTISAVDLMLKPTVYLSRDAKVYVGNKQIETQTSGSAISLVYGLWAYNDVHYIYDVKPEIKSVLVNGESVADGATYVSNSKNVTVKTTYDSVLSQALQDYGCSVKQLSAYYLNGEKINVAALTPVSNGNGTSTKTYNRTLNSGDELTVESWLEVTWPDGSKDVVDERTTNVTYDGVKNVSVSATFSGTPANATSNTDGVKVTNTKWYKWVESGSTAGYVEMSASDTIKEGALYKCEVTVAEDGDKLASGYTVKINGHEAEKKYGTNHTWVYETRLVGTTSYVEVNDIDLPEAYTNPDFTYNDEEGAAYHWDVVQVEWFECDKDGHKLSDALPADHIFEKGGYYRVEVTVVPETNWQFHGSQLSFYINGKAAMPIHGYNKAYPDSVTGYLVYNTADIEGNYELFVYDDSLSGSAKNIYIKDGQYLGSDATAPSDTEPSGGYAYYKDGVLELNGYDNEKAHFIFEEAALELWLIGDNTIGAIYDNEWGMDGGNLETRQGNLVINANPGGKLVIASNPLDAYANIQVKDLYFKGGDVTSCLANGTYGAAVQLNGDNLYLEKGTAAYVSDTNDFGTATKWDGTTDISNYDCVWLKTIGTYQVVFIDDDNTVLDMVRVTVGSTVSEPEEPVKDGYTFLGWYTDDGDKFDFTTPITEDIYLTARYEQLTVISEVNITVTAPAVGATLNKSVACTTEGIDDAYLMTSWYDVATSTYLTDGATFEAGKQYGVDVSTVRAKDGYVLANDVVVKINGKTASKLMQGLYRIEFDALPGNSGSNITVNCIGDIDYTVSGNVVTVDHEVACKVGYLDGTAYKAITAVANGDGTYSFTAPAGVTEVLLVVKGDINGDGEISLADSTRTKAAYNKKTTPTAEAAFAADANGDGEITLADSTRIKAAYNKKTTLSW